MRKKTLVKLLLVLTASFFLSCAGSMPKASDAMDAKAKNLQAPSDKALLYIVRPSTMGFAIKMNVYLNEVLVGKTHGKQYFYMLLEPGKYLLKSKSENESEIPITLKAGEKYFVEQKAKMGFLKARTGLEIINQAEGSELVQKCNLALLFSPNGEELTNTK